MNNYEWQKQYSRQRIDARMREAEAQRLTNEGRRPASGDQIEPSRRNPLAAVLRAITGVFAVRPRRPDAH